MKMSEMYPSKYLAADDLEGESWTLTIKHVEMADMGDGREKPIIYFVGAKKGLACNKTNAKRIAHMYGQDSDMWRGKKITLITEMVDFKGDVVEAIRVQLEKPAKAAKAATLEKPSENFAEQQKRKTTFKKTEKEGYDTVDVDQGGEEDVPF
jgi:hypothetical protein